MELVAWLVKRSAAVALLSVVALIIVQVLPSADLTSLAGILEIQHPFLVGTAEKLTTVAGSL